MLSVEATGVFPSDHGLFSWCRSSLCDTDRRYRHGSGRRFATSIFIIIQRRSLSSRWWSSLYGIDLRRYPTVVVVIVAAAVIASRF